MESSMPNSMPLSSESEVWCPKCISSYNQSPAMSQHHTVHSCTGANRLTHSCPKVGADQLRHVQEDEEEEDDDDDEEDESPNEYARLTPRCNSSASMLVTRAASPAHKLAYKLSNSQHHVTMFSADHNAPVKLGSSFGGHLHSASKSYATREEVQILMEPPKSQSVAADCDMFVSPVPSSSASSSTSSTSLETKSSGATAETPALPPTPTSPTTVVVQDTLLPSSGSNTYRSGSRHPARMASCISVHSTGSISSSDSSLCDYPPNTPICKFCHQRAKANDPLISPCHCRGTIRYMHCRCLMKWLDKLKKRNSRHQPLSCEICNYEYRWRKRFKPTGEWNLPPCVGNDRQWHTVFVICAVLMVISMINLIIFGEEDTRHKSRHSSNSEFGTIRLTAINADRADGGVDPFVHGSKSTPFIGNIFVKNSTANSLFFLQSNLAPNANSTASILLKNLSAAFPSLQNINLIPNRNQSKPAHNSTGKKKPSQQTPESELMQVLQQHSYGSFRLSNEHRRRKNFPTKPSEVILVVSGCLFFITFFLGTFAQIKSEVSFYTMLVRFIHCNQQWIIEEYDPDGLNGNCSGALDSSTGDTNNAATEPKASTPDNSNNSMVVNIGHRPPISSNDGAKQVIDL